MNDNYTLLKESRVREAEELMLDYIENCKAIKNIRQRILDLFTIELSPSYLNGLELIIEIDGNLHTYIVESLDMAYIVESLDMATVVIYGVNPNSSQDVCKITLEHLGCLGMYEILAKGAKNTTVRINAGHHGEELI